MKYCSHCGKEVADEAVICPACGCSVEDKPAQPTESKLSTIALVGFIFAFLMPLVGFIVSIVAMNKAKAAGDEKSRKFALAGLIIGLLECLGVVLVIVLYISVFAALFGAMEGAALTAVVL